MPRKNIASLPEYIGWLFKQYQELKETAQPKSAYKLVDIEENKNGKTILTIQVTGKAITFKSTPQEILADDKVTECFSSKDIRTITYYACQTLNKPKNKIVIKKFCEKLNKMVFGVKNIDKDNISEKTAKEISLDKNLIKNLSPEEAHMVGFTSAGEQASDEKVEMAELRKTRDIGEEE